MSLTQPGKSEIFTQIQTQVENPGKPGKNDLLHKSKHKLSLTQPGKK